MGCSIDYACNSWEKQNIEKNVLNEKYRLKLDSGTYSYVLSCIGNKLKCFYNDYDFLNFDAKEVYNIYKENTEKIKITLKSLTIYNDIQILCDNIEENDILVSLCDDNYNNYLIVCDGTKNIEVIKWVPLNFIPLNEDGKILNMAIGNLSSMYGVSLSPLILSSEELDSYIEGTEMGNYIDNKINRDTNDIYEIFKFSLKVMKPLDYDKFYNDRLERLEILLNAVKNGAKFVYSY